MQRLKSFLDSKPLCYKEIDHERVHIAYKVLKPHIRRPKTIHMVGTNGKGTTGRIIAHLSWRSGLSVGHFSSPHILKFNERIWLDGSDARDQTLNKAHQKLFGILGREISESLSYFEYSTLLAFIVFEDCDLMILEAGLGGEFDATNVCDKELSVITPIGIDHQAFLGDTIEEIAATKIRSIQKQVLLAPQVYDEVVEVAKDIASNVGADLCVCPASNVGADPCVCPQASTQIDPYKLQKISEHKGWGDYLIGNAIVALQALAILHIKYDVKDLLDLELFGRFYALVDNIRIDVGHNPLAAKAIVGSMSSETVLIYNSLDDKDYEEVLRILKPKVKRVEIIPIESQRAATIDKIENALKIVGLEYGYYQNKLNENENYLVFGSFYVVEEFLRKSGL
ncbi:MAG: bifunctional folylpolyglutamate synthase/dihydrofolate synthase [Sulfurovum sp.]|nr:bifunctional folylpolyglutamate synthase/dihydrofolate synthase [Sulfurovum sp.]